MTNGPNNPKSTTGGEFANKPDTFAVNNPTQLSKFAFDAVQPDSPAYIGVEDQFIARCWSAATNFALAVNIRILTPSGKIMSLPLQFGQNAARTGLFIATPGVEGMVLSATLQPIGAFNPGQYVYATLGITRAPNTNSSVYIPLFAGYTHDVIPFGYPSTPSQRPTDGAGVLTSNVISAPAAGADFTFTIPAGARFRPISLFASLTTAIAVANRSVALVLDDGANIYAELDAQVVQAASLTVGYTFADSVTQSNVPGGFTMIPLPSNLFMPAGHRIRSLTGAIQAADQWSAGRMLVQEWLDPT